MRVSPNYFTFESSDVNVASVTNDGNITVHKNRRSRYLVKRRLKAKIKGTLLRFRSNTHERRNRKCCLCSVILILIRFLQTGILDGEWSTAEYTEIDTGDNHIARYSGLNFVGIVFNKTADCSSKTHLHLDVLCMDEVSESTIITVSIYYGTTEIKYPITLEKYPDFKSNSGCHSIWNLKRKIN